MKLTTERYFSLRETRNIFPDSKPCVGSNFQYWNFSTWAVRIWRIFWQGVSKGPKKMSRIFSSCQNFLKTIYVNFVWAKQDLPLLKIPQVNSTEKGKSSKLFLFQFSSSSLFTICSVTCFFYIIRYWQNMKSRVLTRMKDD